MRNGITIFCFSLFFLNVFPQEATSEKEHDILLADPSVFLDKGTYYLYGTTAGSKEATGEGFLVYTSENLRDWDGPKGAKEGFALRKEDVFGSAGFWAPQVFQYNKKFYLAYTANENIAIAVSENPLGPFVNAGQSLDAPVKQIDPFVFFDDDGKKYLYHVRLDNGNRIFVAELTDDLSRIKPETLRECISATEPWENTQNAKWSVSEGPTVIKRDELYYMLYSANDFRNPDYAVGYAVSENPLGPWEKMEGSPFLSKERLGVYGPGHGDLFKAKDEEMYYVFHAHHSKDSVRPRKAALVKIQFRAAEEKGSVLEIAEKTFSLLKQKNHLKEN